MPPACQSLSNTSKGTTENILYKAANKVLKQNKKQRTSNQRHLNIILMCSTCGRNLMNC